MDPEATFQVLFIKAILITVFNTVAITIIYYLVTSWNNRGDTSSANRGSLGFTISGKALPPLNEAKESTGINSNIKIVRLALSVLFSIVRRLKEGEAFYVYRNGQYVPLDMGIPIVGQQNENTQNSDRTTKREHLQLVVDNTLDDD